MVMLGNSKASILKILEKGQVEMEGLVPWGSNYTFLVNIAYDSNEIAAIYKPSKGERPLWDFARGTLCLRERAAYLTSEALGWDVVPPTILRDGPHGWGSLQYYVEHDPQEHYLTLQGHRVDQLRIIALFDAIINNADRKSGHVLLGVNDQLWAIDHGVCFHADYKLRSVIWEFSGQSIPDHIVESLLAFQTWLCNGDDPIYAELSQLLNQREMDALSYRLQRLIEEGIFPHPGSGRHYPWPLV